MSLRRDLIAAAVPWDREKRCGRHDELWVVYLLAITEAPAAATLSVDCGGASAGERPTTGGGK